MKFIHSIQDLTQPICLTPSGLRNFWEPNYGYGTQSDSNSGQREECLNLLACFETILYQPEIWLQFRLVFNPDAKSLLSYLLYLIPPHPGLGVALVASALHDHRTLLADVHIWHSKLTQSGSSVRALAYVYRVILTVRQLGCVDFYLGCFTIMLWQWIAPVAANQLGISHSNQPSS